MRRSAPRDGGSGPLRPRLVVAVSGGMAAARQTHTPQLEAQADRGGGGAGRTTMTQERTNLDGEESSGDLMKTVSTTGDELASMAT